MSDEFREGSVHDKTQFDNSGVVKMLDEKYHKGEQRGEVMVGGKLYRYELCGDKAYPFAEKPMGWVWRVTKTAEETKDVDEEGKERGKKAKKAKLEGVEFDAGVARLRGVVERTIRRIKSWPVFHSPSFCGNLKRTRKMVWISCGLVNWWMIHCDIKQV